MKPKKQNSITVLNTIPAKEEFDHLTPVLTFKHVDVLDLPSEIQENTLTKKFASAIIATSADSLGVGYAVSVIGIRPDNNEIDEHPFVFYYDLKDPSQSFGGIIHHGNWPGRTTKLTEAQRVALEKTGMTEEFAFKGIPKNSSGDLNQLHKQGMLDGFKVQIDLALEKRKKPAANNG